MKTEVVEKLASLITAAFGLVAALAWNDTIRALFAGPCGAENAGALCSLSSLGPWVYAIVVTLLAVTSTIWIGKVAERVKNLKIPRKYSKSKLQEKIAKEEKNTSENKLKNKNKRSEK